MRNHCKSLMLFVEEPFPEMFIDVVVRGHGSSVRGEPELCAVHILGDYEVGSVSLILVQISLVVEKNVLWFFVHRNWFQFLHVAPMSVLTCPNFTSLTVYFTNICARLPVPDRP